MLECDALIYSTTRPEAGWKELCDFAMYKNVRAEHTIEMYGFGSILRSICRLPKWWPLKLKSQHGVSLWQIPPEHELRAPEWRLLVHSRRWVDIYRSHGDLRAVAIGSPFVMFRRRLLRSDVVEQTCSGRALFFLSHSTFWEKAEWQAEKLISALEEIRSRHGGLTVCVHFVDVLNGLARTIFDAGFDVATAGNYYNSEFPRNFYTLLLGHEELYTNAVGSHVFYAVEAGRFMQWIDTPVSYVNIGYSQETWENALRERPIEVEVMQCLKSGAEGRSRLERICRDELGLDAMAEPLYLLLLIMQANVYWYFVRQAKLVYWKLARRR